MSKNITIIKRFGKRKIEKLLIACIKSLLLTALINPSYIIYHCPQLDHIIIIRLKNCAERIKRAKSISHWLDKRVYKDDKSERSLDH